MRLAARRLFAQYAFIRFPIAAFSAAVHWRGPRLVLGCSGLVVGWVFGRLGCTLVHDHIGKLSDFALAIRFPDGARHDLGFYELLYTVLVLVPAVIWLNRLPRRPGTAICLIPLLYAPARFLGDFLRVSLPGHDPRYAGLTLAQYACIAVAGLVLALAYRLRRTSATGPQGQSLTSS